MLPNTRCKKYLRESRKIGEAVSYVTSFGTLGMAKRIRIFSELSKII